MSVRFYKYLWFKVHRSIKMVNRVGCIHVNWTRDFRDIIIGFTLPCSLKLQLSQRMTKPTITKTCLYNFDPLKPHFYIVKLGFTGVYIIFRISAQNIDCGYSFEPPRRGGSNEYPQSMFCVEIRKISEFFI